MQILFSNIDISLQYIMMKTKTQYYELINIIQEGEQAHIKQKIFSITLNVLHRIRFLGKLCKPKDS